MTRTKIAAAVAVPILALSGMAASAPAAHAVPVSGPTNSVMVYQSWLGGKICGWAPWLGRIVCKP